mgnify:CR=1 FL=1
MAAGPRFRFGATEIVNRPPRVVVESDLADGETPESVGFVTGALKKTGQSIARTGARTGASIRNALVSFGGAFRKLRAAGGAIDPGRARDAI